MKQEVQIIVFRRDPKRYSNYLYESGSELYFNWFSISEPLDPNIKKRGATFVIDYFSSNVRKFITGLIPLKNIKNTYIGDIDGETIAFWLSPDKETVRIALFKGHTPTRVSARIKKVELYIKKKAERPEPNNLSSSNMTQR